MLTAHAGLAPVPPTTPGLATRPARACAASRRLSAIQLAVRRSRRRAPRPPRAARPGGLPHRHPRSPCRARPTDTARLPRSRPDLGPSTRHTRSRISRARAWSSAARAPPPSRTARASTDCAEGQRLGPRGERRRLPGERSRPGNRRPSSASPASTSRPRGAHKTHEPGAPRRTRTRSASAIRQRSRLPEATRGILRYPGGEPVK